MALNSRHVLWDLAFDEADCLRTPDTWRRVLRESALAAGATILHERYHQFEPYGFTGYLLLAESHISIHTWPEERFAALDIFTCGAMDTGAILDSVRRELQPSAEHLHEHARQSPGRESIAAR